MTAQRSTKAMLLLLVITLTMLSCSLQWSKPTAPASPNPGSFKYGDPNAFADRSPSAGVSAEAPDAQTGTPSKKGSGGSASSGGGGSSSGVPAPAILDRDIVDFGGLGD